MIAIPESELSLEEVRALVTITAKRLCGSPGCSGHWYDYTLFDGARLMSPCSKNSLHLRYWSVDYIGTRSNLTKFLDAEGVRKL